MSGVDAEALISQAESGSQEALAELRQLGPDPDLLRRFSSSRLPELQFRAAGDARTPVDAVEVLARLRDLGLRAALLERAELPESVLLILAESEPLVLRILMRADCPVSMLDEAARGTDPDRQLAAASNLRTPVDAIDAMARNASHPLVDDALWKWAEVDTARLPAFARALSAELRTNVAKHPETPPEILLQLSRDADEDVRLAVAGRKDLPGELVLRFLTDTSPAVVRVAEQQPAAQRRHRKFLWGSVFTGIAVGIGGLVLLLFVLGLLAAYLQVQ